MVERKTKLSIFDTFKTKTQQLTGEAKRQRSIIQHLTDSTSSASKTRTSISQKIAEENAIKWKNIYSGVFRDLDEVLIPLGLVEEEGRLPLKRGPKALQQNGMPFYHLTDQGLLVALSINEVQNREKIVDQIISKCIKMLTTVSVCKIYQNISKGIKLYPKCIKPYKMICFKITFFGI